MITGGLFTRDWLLEGVTESAAWAALDDAAGTAIRGLLGKLLARRQPN